MTDMNLFHPKHRTHHSTRTGCVLIYIGRFIPHKKIHEFLTLPEDLGQKIVAGVDSGNNKKAFQKMFPNVEFIEYETNQELAVLLANADVLVTPNNIEAVAASNACGTPVAANISSDITDYVNGVTHYSLTTAIIDAATLDRANVRKYAEQYLRE